MKSLIEKTINPLIDFLKDVPKSVVIVHDDDCDGICSAAIFITLLKRLGSKKVKNFSLEPNFSLTLKVVKEILREKPFVVIFLDVPSVEKDLLKFLKKIKVIVLDHHPPQKYPKRVIYSNPRLFDYSAYLPTSCLSYYVWKKFFDGNKILWISAIGTLADWGVKGCKFLFRELKRKYPELIKTEIDQKRIFEDSLLGELCRLVDSLNIVEGKKGAERAARLLAECESFWDLIKGKGKYSIFRNYNGKVEKEFSRILEDFRKEKIEKEKVIFYVFESKFKLKSRLATLLKEKYRDKIVVIGQKSGKWIDLSLRVNYGKRIDLSEIMEKIKKKMKISGGGHPKAAAARIPFNKVEDFIRNLEVELNEKENSYSR